MKAELYDCPTRFMVTSESDPDAAYLVDLLENNRRGKCACHHWQFRVQPALDKGEEASPCKHVVAAREQFTELMLLLAEKHSKHQDSATTT